eukprot:CAMPEP_0197546068 /NCGR_PEP_ID=MMETSP1320-20131121/841_1 /TAXON_ID=91990 /ORGANISM="Bolidomonas sp., Strain RCC2347" /LENGTH=108 /DNA_ID=CAMNT_0043105615 /DNA_START=295 /DNA_END=618 /DNA_ORIENTATION=+
MSMSSNNSLPSQDPPLTSSNSNSSDNLTNSNSNMPSSIPSNIPVTAEGKNSSPIAPPVETIPSFAGSEDSDLSKQQQQQQQQQQAPGLSAPLKPNPPSDVETLDSAPS